MSQEFDIAVFGASGFIGKLVAEYLAQRQRSDPPRGEGGPDLLPRRFRESP